MQLHSQQIYKLLGKASIAVIARWVILFYNIQTIHTPGPTTEESYTIITNNQGHYVQTWEEKESLENKIIIDSQWSWEEQQYIKELTLETMYAVEDKITYYKSIAESIQTITINKEKSSSRWYSSHNSIVINYGDMSRQEFKEVLTHELGHIIDLWVLHGYSSKKNEVFSEFEEFVFEEDDPSLMYYSLSRDWEDKKKAQSTKQDFCTTYGMSNPFEDFAECLNLYLYHHEYFSTLIAWNKILEKKYEYIAKIFGYQYIQWWKIDNNKSKNYRYRDSTRIK